MCVKMVGIYVSPCSKQLENIIGSCKGAGLFVWKPLVSVAWNHSGFLWKPTSFPLFQCVRQSTLNQTSPSPAPAHQVTANKAAGGCALDCMPRVSAAIRSTASHGCAVSWPLSLLESTGHVQIIGSLSRAKKPLSSLWFSGTATGI